MVHVGERDFFRNVYRDAFAHDVVLVEGVRSPIVRRLTRSYRWIEGSRLSLIVQPPYPPADGAGARVVQADLTGKEFEAEWRRVPPRLRLFAFILAPIVGLAHRWLASRESIARRLQMDDYRSREETLSWNPALAALKHSILHARDVRLVELLRVELERPSLAGLRLAIVYGAAHMRAVLDELRRRGFSSVDSGWQTIFGFDEPEND